jgi:hypothetical protein
MQPCNYELSPLFTPFPLAKLLSSWDTRWTVIVVEELEVDELEMDDDAAKN